MISQLFIVFPFRTILATDHESMGDLIDHTNRVRQTHEVESTIASSCSSELPNRNKISLRHLG